ncbi:MAG: YkgJ family cysteine cluster protein [Candidatus Bathyarchaeia archaeon]
MDGVFLESGEPCLKYGCTLCCHGTIMPLTWIDIKRIVKLGYGISDFAERINREWRLRNVHGRCFFLEGSRCKIYRYRPYGCQLYPLVYDWSRRKITLDKLCPYRGEFKIRGEDARKLMFVLNSLRRPVKKQKVFKMSINNLSW